MMGVALVLYTIGVGKGGAEADLLRATSLAGDGIILYGINLPDFPGCVCAAGLNFF
jgi:hypothetical protein